MRNRKTLLLILALVLSLTLAMFASCGNDDNGNGEPPADNVQAETQPDVNDPVTTDEPQEAPPEEPPPPPPPPELQLFHRFTFTPAQQPLYEEWFVGSTSHGESVIEMTWAFPFDGDYVLRVAHMSDFPEGGVDPDESMDVFTAQRNAVQVVFPEPLEIMTRYEISIWLFVPSNDDYGLNPGFGNVRDGKGPTFAHPSFLVNSVAGEAYFTRQLLDADDQPIRVPMDTWVELRAVFFSLSHRISNIDFRFHVNDWQNYPDVWYIGSITIAEEGYMD
jgi:hypothetical protein